MVSERFPSGFRVVSAWFWRVPNLSEDLSGGLSPEGCPGVWGVRAFGPSKLSGGLSLKAVQRVVRGFVRGVVRGFKPVWTQHVQAGVYAEPPLSTDVWIFRIQRDATCWA